MPDAPAAQPLAPAPRWRPGLTPVAAIVALWLALVPAFGLDTTVPALAGDGEVPPVAIRISPASGALGMGALAPGEATYSALGVHNEGALPFTYRLVVDARDPDGRGLAETLRIELRRVAGTCDVETFHDSAQTVLAARALAGAVADGGLVVAPGAADHLCVRVSLPAGTSDELDGARVDATVHATAVQT